MDKDVEIIHLTDKQFDEFERILETCTEPTEALKELMARPVCWAENKELNT